MYSLWTWANVACSSSSSSSSKLSGKLSTFSASMGKTYFESRGQQQQQPTYLRMLCYAAKWRPNALLLPLVRNIRTEQLWRTLHLYFFFFFFWFYESVLLHCANWRINCCCCCCWFYEKCIRLLSVYPSAVFATSTTTIVGRQQATWRPPEENKWQHIGLLRTQF